jgi:neurofibromin 1
MSLVVSELAINALIAKYVGRILFHISASNWNLVFERFSTKINFIATHPELNPDFIDFHLMDSFLNFFLDPVWQRRHSKDDQIIV